MTRSGERPGAPSPEPVGAARVGRSSMKWWVALALLVAAGCGGGRELDAALKARDLSPEDWRAWARLGRALDATGDHEGAMDAFDEAMDLDADDPAIFERAAAIAGSFGLFRKARDYARLGLYAQGEHPGCHRMAAQALVSLGEDEVARQHLGPGGLVGLPGKFSVSATNALLGKLQFDAEGKFFVVRTDIGHAATRNLAATADLIYTRYHDLFPGLRPLRPTPKIFVFEQKKDWDAMIRRYNRSHAEAEGLTVADRSGGVRVVSCLETRSVYAGQISPGEAWIHRILLHELNHVAMLAISKGRPPPLWLMEGYAEYTSGASPRLPGFPVGGGLPLRSLELQYLAKKGRKPMRLKRLLGGSSWQAQGLYAYAWSFVHFLHHGEGGRYRQRFQGLLREVAKGRGEGAFFAAYGDLDQARLEREWHAYLARL